MGITKTSINNNKAKVKPGSIHETDIGVSVEGHVVTSIYLNVPMFWHKRGVRSEVQFFSWMRGLLGLCFGLRICLCLQIRGGVALEGFLYAR